MVNPADMRPRMAVHPLRYCGPSPSRNSWLPMIRTAMVTDLSPADLAWRDTHEALIGSAEVQK